MKLWMFAKSFKLNLYYLEDQTIAEYVSDQLDFSFYSGRLAQEYLPCTALKWKHASVL